MYIDSRAKSGVRKLQRDPRQCNEKDSNYRMNMKNPSLSEHIVRWLGFEMKRETRESLSG